MTDNPDDEPSCHHCVVLGYGVPVPTDGGYIARMGVGDTYIEMRRGQIKLNGITTQEQFDIAWKAAGMALSEVILWPTHH